MSNQKKSEIASEARPSVELKVMPEAEALAGDWHPTEIIQLRENDGPSQRGLVAHIHFPSNMKKSIVECIRRHQTEEKRLLFQDERISYVEKSAIKDAAEVVQRELTRKQLDTFKQFFKEKGDALVILAQKFPIDSPGDPAKKRLEGENDQVTKLALLGLAKASGAKPQSGDRKPALFHLIAEDSSIPNSRESESSKGRGKLPWHVDGHYYRRTPGKIGRAVDEVRAGFKRGVSEEFLDKHRTVKKFLDKSEFDARPSHISLVGLKGNGTITSFVDTRPIVERLREPGNERLLRAAKGCNFEALAGDASDKRQGQGRALSLLEVSPYTGELVLGSWFGSSSRLRPLGEKNQDAADVLSFVAQEIERLPSFGVAVTPGVAAFSRNLATVHNRGVVKDPGRELVRSEYQGSPQKRAAVPAVARRVFSR